MRPFFKKIMTAWMAGILLTDEETENEKSMSAGASEADYADMYGYSRGMYPDHDICDMYCRYLYR